MSNQQKILNVLQFVENHTSVNCFSKIYDYKESLFLCQSEEEKEKKAEQILLCLGFI